jgi:iron complex outermembrane receptor protein
MNRSGFLPVVLGALIALSGTQTDAGAQVRPPDLTTLDLEQLMELEVVFAASKRNQKPSEVASVVTVVTALQIKQQGFRTLADILRSVPSFYVSYDRNYSYVGVRGFLQAGDFSSRVLLLLNGLRTNDNIYDQAMVGEEFVVDVDLIDRVEVVRGPSAAIYGSSAFFAVINVVTKRGNDINGAEITGSAASFGTYAARATYGKAFTNGIELLASASGVDGTGVSRLYFPEFDDQSTNDGIAEDVDAESSRKLFLAASMGNFALEASHVERRKTLPTASYGTSFNDPRTQTVDRLLLASISYDRSFANGSVSGRLHAGQWTYSGEYAFDAMTQPNQDRAYGDWFGLDMGATRSFGARDFVTVGLEYRDNYRQDQKNFEPDPYNAYINAQNASQRLGIYAQNELTLFKPLVLYTGVRHDWYETFGSATSPRVGLIYNPGEATTLKLLLGRAFRAPNEFEFHYGGGFSYKLNSALGPERIETLELAAERRIGRGARVTASAFRNTITDLISLEVDPVDDLLVFRNARRIDSEGLELGFGWNRGRGITGDFSVMWQETTDRASGVRLTNSPPRMAKAQIVVPIIRDRLSAGMNAQYVAASGTLAGRDAKEFIVTNLSLLAPKLFHHLEMNASVYNLFGVPYGYPGSQEHVQDIIQQDGRSFRVKATLRF